MRQQQEKAAGHVDELMAAATTFQTGFTAIDREEVLERVGGDEELLCEIVDIYLEEYPTLLTGISEALTTGDAKALERSAHSLKGSSANFGAKAVTDLALTLEIAGRKGVLSNTAEPFEQLKTELLNLRAALLEVVADRA